eukprot:8018482-Karenia_brevis.AAC.1
MPIKDAVQLMSESSSMILLMRCGCSFQWVRASTATEGDKLSKAAFTSAAATKMGASIGHSNPFCTSKANPVLLCSVRCPASKPKICNRRHLCDF